MLNVSYEEFGNLVIEFFEYMGQEKKPSKSRLELWFREIRKIKSTEVSEAFDYLKKNLDGLPRNIPKQIKLAIFEINRSKPQPKPEIKSYGECDDCNGTGIFKARICSPQGIWTEPIYFCSQCENYRNWTNEPGDRMSKAELEAMGIKYKPYNKVLKYSNLSGPAGTPVDFKNIAVKIGENKRLNEGEKHKNRNIDPDKVA